jgi:hypothetical protein
VYSSRPQHPQLHWLTEEAGAKLALAEVPEGLQTHDAQLRFVIYCLERGLLEGSPSHVATALVLVQRLEVALRHARQGSDGSEDVDDVTW